MTNNYSNNSVIANINTVNACLLDDTCCTDRYNQPGFHINIYSQSSSLYSREACGLVFFRQAHIFVVLNQGAFLLDLPCDGSRPYFLFSPSPRPDEPTDTRRNTSAFSFCPKDLPAGAESKHIVTQHKGEN